MKITLIFFIVLISAVFFINAQNKPAPLEIGNKAPNFNLLSENNKSISLEQFKGQPIVLYFFPKSDTPGWTKQACGFRDIYNDYKENNIVVIGISYDSPKSLLSFKEKYALPFYLLSDSEKIVAKLYGANGLLVPRRITYLIDPDGFIQKVYNKINLNTHAEEIFNDITKNN